jgi:hypothetical protein
MFPLLAFGFAGLLLAQKKSEPKSKEAINATATTKVPMPDADTNTVRRYPKLDEMLDKTFFGGSPPASCSEWATFPPSAASDAKCKELGGKPCCARCNGPSYDVGPQGGLGTVGQPFKVHLRIRHLGVGDYIIYSFGKIDWGDNSQQDVIPLGQDVELVHKYDTADKFTIHVMGGAQFKYQGDGSCSYECCTDNTIPVTINP